MYLKDNDALHYAPVWGCDAMDAPYSCWLLAVRCSVLSVGAPGAFALCFRGIYFFIF